MKLELLIFAITGFLIANTYSDGKYTKMLTIGKKYIKMAMFAFVGFSIYLLLKKNPDESRSILSHVNTLIRYMPIDKDTTDLITPFFDFSRIKNDINNFSTNNNQAPSLNPQTPQMKRMMGSGKTNKRCVSETKKKWVASQQNWKCAKCQNQLSATFEVDHKVDLQLGGSNHVSNLAALCRECHGNKTMMRNLQ